jgi:probable addiction module antidote protein
LARSILEACFEEAGNDAAFISKALGNVAKARGMTQLAKDCDLGRESLYKALSGEGNPSFETILKVLKALNMQLHVSKVDSYICTQNHNLSKCEHTNASIILTLTVKTPSTNLPAQRQNPLSGFSTRPPNRHKARIRAQLCVLARLRLRYGGWAGPPSGGPGWFGPVLRTPFSPPP